MQDLEAKGVTVIVEKMDQIQFNLHKGKVFSQTTGLVSQNYYLNPGNVPISLISSAILVPNNYQASVASNAVIQPVTAGTRSGAAGVLSGKSIGSRSTSSGSTLSRVVQGKSSISSGTQSEKAAAPDPVAAKETALGAALLAWSLYPKTPGPEILNGTLKQGNYDSTPQTPTHDDIGKKAVLARGTREGGVWEGVIVGMRRTKYVIGKPSGEGQLGLKVESEGALKGETITIQAHEAVYFAKNN